MQADRTELFETMPVRQAVLRQIVPSVISQMIGLIYTLVDTFVVGWLNDPVQTAAVTVAIPFFVLTTAIANLFGVGGAAALAQALGRHETDSVRSISAITAWFSLLAGILFALLTRLFLGRFAVLIGATEETFSAVCGYLTWTVIISAPMTVTSLALANLVRAEGSAFAASFGSCLGGVLNMLLDPLFVLPQFLGRGAVGAGMATGISNWVSCLFFLTYILLSRRTVLTVSPVLLKDTRRYLGTILLIGFPASVQYALTVVAAAALGKFVSVYPTEAVAGMGIARKLVESPLYFAIGVANGLLPILSYNYGSGNQERRREAFRFGCMIAIGCSLIFLLLFETAAPFFCRLFIREEATVAYAAAFLRIQVLAQPLVAVNYPLIVHFQAMGKVRESLICSILRKGTLDIPLLFIADRLYPLYGLMWVQFLVDTLALVMALTMYRRINRSLSLPGGGSGDKSEN